MRQGLIFSIDAIISVIFVVALAATFSLYQTTSTIDTFLVGNFNLQTSDSAIIAYYLDQDYTDFNGIKGSFNTVDANQAKCNRIPYYALSGDHDPAQITIGEKKFCMEIT